MTLQQAMAVIARFQATLVEGGVNIGTYGPRGDGIDGRYGPATQTGVQNLGTVLDIDPALEKKKPSKALLITMGFTPEDVTVLKQAIDVWWKWREANVSNPDYEAMATAALCEAVPDLCMAPANGNGMEPATNGAPTDLAHYQPQKKGWPWWAWALVGLGVAAAVGGGIFAWWYFYKRKSRPKRKRKTAPSSTNGYGTKITDQEFSYEPPEDDEGG